MSEDADVLVRLPDEHRAEFKDPLGPVYADPAALLEAVTGQLVTIGDVVSYHMIEAGRVPDVAVVDGRSERTAVDPEIDAVLQSSPVEQLRATNPPGQLTMSLVSALKDAIDREGRVQVVVDGEEDLATVPVVLLAPRGTAVVYGQPGRGMVHIDVTPENQSRARSLLALMEGDHETLASMIGP